MAIIVCILIAFAVILIIWMWHNLGDMKSEKKITYIFMALIIMYFLTFIIYNISKIGIKYDNKNAMKTIRKVYVFMFTIINSSLVFPHLFKRMDQLDNEEIKEEEFKKSILKLLIFILIVFAFEIYYLGNAQKGILTSVELRFNSNHK